MYLALGLFVVNAERHSLFFAFFQVQMTAFGESSGQHVDQR